MRILNVFTGHCDSDDHQWTTEGSGRAHYSGTSQREECVKTSEIGAGAPQWSRVKAGFARWLPAGDLPRLPLLLVFLLGAALGVGLTMLAHPHAWCVGFVVFNGCKFFTSFSNILSTWHSCRDQLQPTTCTSALRRLTSAVLMQA